ncbi:hypothetical protein LguiB_017885 [Lonicera macranthoides]
MDFLIGNVVSLDLSYSKLKQVWKGTMVLGPLKILNLSHSLQLVRTLDFLGLPNLKKLILKGCVGLLEVCELIGSLEGLVLLNLEDCTNLRKFSNIGNLKFLETLIIAGCSNMGEFLANLKNEESLKVFKAGRFVINHLLPNTVKGFKLRDAFSWPWLSKPRKSAEGFWASLPHSLVNLSLANCNLLDDSLTADLCNLLSLQSLDLSKNPLRRVPDCINRLRGLEVLQLYDCRILQYVRMTNISTKTKDLSWIYKPWLFGIPAEDGEELAWLSHWKFGTQLESGDEIIISIVTGASFEVKGCGFDMVWVDQKEKETSFNTRYDLASNQGKTGVYVFSNHNFYNNLGNCSTALRWFRELFDDSIEFEEKQVWHNPNSGGPKVSEGEHGTAVAMDENLVDYDRKAVDCGTQTIEGLILDMHMLKDDVRSGFKSKNTKKRRYEEFVDEPLLSNKANSLKRRYFNFLLWQSTDFSLRSPNKVELTIEGFARMDNLIFLQLNYVELTGCYENFPQSLRWLCWHGFSLKSLPMDLPMGNLVSLDLSYSKLKRAWTGTMVLGSLKILNLSHCLQLARTPDFFGLPNLEKLILKGCVGLIEVCESIGSLEGLVLLSLEDCKNLRKFPNISKLKFLETLIIAGCSNMSEFLRDLKKVDSLKVFQANKVAINHLLPNAVRGFKLWDAFSWRWLSKPRKSVEGFWASLPHSLVNLSLADCNLSHDSFPADLCNLVSLRALDLSLNPVHRVADCINRLRRLKVLRLDHCRRLQYICVTNVEQLSMVESTSV